MNAEEEIIMKKRQGCECCNCCQCWRKGPCPCDKKENSNCRCCSNCACEDNGNQSKCCCKK